MIVLGRERCSRRPSKVDTDKLVSFTSSGGEMDHHTKTKSENIEESTPDDAAQADVEDQVALEITVRKLEVPIRPRGVLAD